VPHPADEIGWSPQSSNSWAYRPLVSALPFVFGLKLILVLEGVEMCMKRLTSDYRYIHRQFRQNKDWFPVLPIELDVTLKTPDLKFKRLQIPLTPGLISFFILVN
jgi:hypothetical protein